METPWEGTKPAPQWLCPHHNSAWRLRGHRRGGRTARMSPACPQPPCRSGPCCRQLRYFFLHRTYQSRDFISPEMWGKELQVLLEQSSGGTWLRVWMEFSLDLAMAVPVVPISYRGRSWSSSGLAQPVPGAVKVLLRGGRHRLAPFCCRSSWSQSPGAP